MQAETAAQAFLEQEGYQLITRNYRSRQGEIDLIMHNESLLIFVEVRLRNHSRFGGAAASVTAAKQQKVIACAQTFLQHHPHYSHINCRFDVVALEGKPSQWKIDWLPAAFTT